MNIVIEYDSSAANAPAGFKQAVQAAVQFYDYLITDPITVPIVFSYGEIQGQAISNHAVAESSTRLVAYHHGCFFVLRPLLDGVDLHHVLVSHLSRRAGLAEEPLAGR